MDEFDDDFGDDPLNDLLGQDLDALEQQAFHSTQAPRARSNPQAEQQVLPASQYAYESFENGDDDDEIIDVTRDDLGAAELAPQPPLPAYKATLPAYRPPTRSAANPPTNGQVVPNAVPKPNPRGPLQRAQSALAYRPGTQAFRPPQVIRQVSPLQPEAGPSDPTIGTESARLLALEAQVQELLLEKQKLQTAVQNANKQILTKSGEIAIVRSNYDKSIQDKDQKVAELQREVAAANERHKAELEHARKQQEQITTESRFADHDRIVDKTRRRKQPARNDDDVIVKRPAARAVPKAVTPRRDRHASVGDGFNLSEMSPSKSRAQAQQLTPRAAERKRKRPQESPVKPMSINEDSEVVTGDEDGFVCFDADPQPLPMPMPMPSAGLDQRYEILQRFLNRRTGVQKLRTLEILAEHKFPSDKDTAMSTLIYDEISKLSAKGSAQDYTSALCGIVVGLWQRCLSEKYFPPLMYFVDIVPYMLERIPDATSPTLDDLVTLLQKTADINLIPRFKRSLRKTASDPGVESEHVNATECLESLVQTVMTCSDNPDLLERFWSLMRVDFLSMLLRSCQAIPDIMLVCRLLTYSTRSSGFGPVLHETESQPAPGGFTNAKAQDHLIDRITALLIETPRNPSSPNDPYTQAKIAEMRLEVLALIEVLAQSDHSAMVFVQQNYAVGRIVRCMNDEFHYAMELLHAWEDRMEVVNQATRLLYHFVYRYADEMDINEKLRAIPGGAHKYLIVLTRLAFSEGSIWGEQVDEEVVDCAHEMLEDHVNPEEGEALMAAFQSGGRRY